MQGLMGSYLDSCALRSGGGDSSLREALSLAETRVRDLELEVRHTTNACFVVRLLSLFDYAIERKKVGEK